METFPSEAGHLEEIPKANAAAIMNRKPNALRFCNTIPFLWYDFGYRASEEPEYPHDFKAGFESS